jgi:hypothetical protein
MPWKWFEGTQMSTGQWLEGRTWYPSGRYREEHHQLARLIDKYIAEKDRQFEDLGYYTTTMTLPEIEDWLDKVIDRYRYGRRSWWDRLKGSTPHDR